MKPRSSNWFRSVPASTSSAVRIARAGARRTSSRGLPSAPARSLAATAITVIRVISTRCGTPSRCGIRAARCNAIPIGPTRPGTATSSRLAATTWSGSISPPARELGQLYALTNEAAYARRAALIIDRFAQVFPGWCYHYNYRFSKRSFTKAPFHLLSFAPAFGRRAGPGGRIWIFPRHSSRPMTGFAPAAPCPIRGASNANCSAMPPTR